MLGDLALSQAERGSNPDFAFVSGFTPEPQLSLL